MKGISIVGSCFFCFVPIQPEDHKLAKLWFQSVIVAMSLIICVEESKCVKMFLECRVYSLRMLLIGLFVSRRNFLECDERQSLERYRRL